MEISDLRKHWDFLSGQDAMWAILTSPGRNRPWDREEFLATGTREIATLIGQIDEAGIDRHNWRRVLDFGCGIGRLSQALAGYFPEVVGVDISPVMIQQARELNRHGERCSYLANDKPNLGVIPTGSVDLIYSNIVLQHMHPSYSASYIAEFVRVLSPDGLCVFQLPTAPRWSSVGIPLRVMPMRLIRLFRKMDMYGMGLRRVETIVNTAGGTIVRRLDDENAGPHWKSYRYFITRAERPGLC